MKFSFTRCSLIEPKFSNYLDLVMHSTEVSYTFKKNTESDMPSINI